MLYNCHVLSIRNPYTFLYSASTVVNNPLTTELIDSNNLITVDSETNQIFYLQNYYATYYLKGDTYRPHYYQTNSEGTS